MKMPQTLFARTALTLAIAFLLMLLFNAGIFGKMVMVPTTRQASEDAAALLVLSAQTWAELPPHTRADFATELKTSHGIIINEASGPLNPVTSLPMHLGFLQIALSQRIGTPITLGNAQTQNDWFEVDLPIGGRNLRMGFTRERFAPGTTSALFWLVLAAALATLATTLLLVRHLTRPLKALSDATVSFGHGETPPALEQTGPEELKNLTRQFNRMTTQLNELLENRTTLLAGISHDLRTPIARLALALEMMPTETDPQLLSSMQKDLREMDELISRTLLLARNMDSNHSDQDIVELAALIDGVVTELQTPQQTILWKPEKNCTLQLNAVALRRVLANLLENSLRYAEGAEVSVLYSCNKNHTTIEIQDQGPGIPETQLKTVFQPFYRLETSRNMATGGSGLGLAIVQQLCHANGWKVTLKNLNPTGLSAQIEIESS